MTLPAYAMSVSSFPEMYEHQLVEPLFRPWAEVLLRAVEPRAGDAVIDVACGTGIVARLVRARVGARGRVVGVDLSAPMLEVARRIAPSVDWREGNASALPVADGERFDLLYCQQGVQFFAERAAAAREMHRVLAPGGRDVVATWRAVEEIPAFRDLLRVGELHVGPIVDQRYAFGDPAALGRLLEEAGFGDVRVETLSHTVRFAEGAAFVRMNAMAIVGMSARSASMSEEERARTVDAIVADSATVLPPYSDGAALSFEMSTNLATARA